MATTIKNLDDFKALESFFRIIEKGLEGIADCQTAPNLDPQSASNFDPSIA